MIYLPLRPSYIQIYESIEFRWTFSLTYHSGKKKETFFQGWFTVCDGGPTLNQPWLNVWWTMIESSGGGWFTISNYWVLTDPMFSMNCVLSARVCTMGMGRQHISRWNSITTDTIPCHKRQPVLLFRSMVTAATRRSFFYVYANLDTFFRRFNFISIKECSLLPPMICSILLCQHTKNVCSFRLLWYWCHQYDIVHTNTHLVVLRKRKHSLGYLN